MAKKFSVPRGTTDILPTEILAWQDIEEKARKLSKIYGFREIRTPIYEESALFKRSLGQTSDVVNKQLLELAGDQKEGFALRPEGTASIVRSYIENGLDRKESISKLFYMGSMFRGERPQKGRLREFHQIGAEVIGPSAKSPYLDAEIIALAVNMLKSFGANDFVLKINSLGSAEDKTNFSKWLREQLKPFVSELSENDQGRYERNVFRVLDSKDEKAQKVIASLDIGYDHLCSESKAYFDQVKSALDQLKVEYVEDPKLVRGLDYYTDTVFEISCSSLGSQDALGAGGRYNNLVDQLGGPKVDAIGFALGIERILLAIGDREDTKEGSLLCYVIAMEEECFPRAFELLNTLREKQIPCDICYKTSSMKNQMKAANKSLARFAMILGKDEMQKGIVTLKDMKEGNQQEIEIDKIDNIIKVLRN
jgi:histidyl-tRNA synthetase